MVQSGSGHPYGVNRLHGRFSHLLILVPFVILTTSLQLYGAHASSNTTILSQHLIKFGAAVEAMNFAGTQGIIDETNERTVQTYLDVMRVVVNDDDDYMVLVDITASSMSDGDDLEAYLDEVEKTDGGNTIKKTACYRMVCSAFVKLMETTQQLAEMEMITNIQPSLMARNVGSVEGEASEAMNADDVRVTFGVSGSGVNIGVLSDSFDCINPGVGYLTDIGTGDLPNDVTVLDDISAGCIDEGRAMLQLVHDVAPGAKLFFDTAFLGIADFAQGIQDLAMAGCDVIVDDIIYFLEPMFQDGLIAQSANLAASQGIPYFSSYGNQARQAWVERNGFQDDGVGNHQFSPGVIRNSFEITDTSSTHILVLQWDEPSFSSGDGINRCNVNLDFGIFVTGTNTLVAGAAEDNIANGEPMELIVFTPTSTGTFDLVIQLTATANGASPPSYMRIWANGFNFDPAINVDDPETGFGHAHAADAAGVGATAFFNSPEFGTSPPVINGFSSLGGGPIFFDADGNRLVSPESRMQPRFVGTDGDSNTFFGSPVAGPDPNFFGTSAAAPNVAAIAALMLEIDNTLTPAAIYSLLEQTAIDMDDPFTVGVFDTGFDVRTGFGLVDALEAANLLTATPSPITPSPVTLSPVTPSPVTSSPVTSSPITSSPVTPSPVTSSPITSSPVTPSPVTSSPITSSPVTPSPVTSSPVTSSPVTPSPITPSPVTSSPITGSPISPTSSPVTSSPATPSPITASPVTSSPVQPTPAPQSCRRLWQLLFFHPCRLDCFSLSSTVVSKTKGTIPLSELKVNDEIITTLDGQFERVYAIPHYHTNRTTNFLQIHTGTGNVLELTPDHLLFIATKDHPIPASSIAVGDRLAGTSSSNYYNDDEDPVVVVSQIVPITKNGFIAPFTMSGRLVVDGILASSYAATLVDDDTESIEAFGVPIVDHHSFVDMTMTPYRFVCTVWDNLCVDESRDDYGYTPYLQFSITARNVIVQMDDHGWIRILAVTMVAGIMYPLSKVLNLFLWIHHNTSLLDVILASWTSCIVSLAVIICTWYYTYRRRGTYGIHMELTWNKNTLDNKG